jgi:hypothetical protein
MISDTFHTPSCDERNRQIQADLETLELSGESAVVAMIAPDSNFCCSAKRND